MQDRAPTKPPLGASIPFFHGYAVPPRLRAGFARANERAQFFSVGSRMSVGALDALLAGQQGPSVRVWTDQEALQALRYSLLCTGVRSASFESSLYKGGKWV